MTGNVVNKRRKVGNLVIHFSLLRFAEYETPLGWLPNFEQEPGAHGLFYYSLIGKNTYDDIINDPIVYEGDLDPVADLWNLFKNIAFMYGVEPPDQMGRYWSAVRMQWAQIGITLLPEKYQFAKEPANIRTRRH